MLAQNRETYKDCFEEGFQLAMANLDRNGEGGTKALVMANCSINT